MSIEKANKHTKQDTRAEEELEQGATGLGDSRPRTRVGVSVLKSNLTDDFANMFFPAQKDARQKGQGREGPSVK